MKFSNKFKNKSKKRNKSKKYKSKKYKSNKSKKNKNKKMYGGFPCRINDKVYMFNGHGCSKTDYFDVPEYCVYVTLALCDNVTKNNSLSQQNFYSLFIEKNDILKNPCDHRNFLELNNSYFNKDDITEESIVDKTYSEDQPAFNIHYYGGKDYLGKYLAADFTLHLSWLYLENKATVTQIPESAYYFEICPSGLYEMTNNSRTDLNSLIEISKNPGFNQIMLTQENIDFIYTGSLFPTLSGINKRINKYHVTNVKDYVNKFQTEDNLDTENNNNYIISITDFFDLTKRNITLYELFEKFPGVHYNIVCRKNCEAYILPSGEFIFKPLTLQREKSIDTKQILIDQVNQDYIDEYIHLLNNIHDSETLMALLNMLVTTTHIDNSILVNLQNNDGDTALHIACRQKNERVSKYLLQILKAQNDIPNNAGELANCEFLSTIINKK